MQAIDINVKDALNATIEIAKKPVELIDKHATYAPIYLAPTSNVKDTVRIYSKKDTVLTVGSMGAFPFELAINGAKTIDCFDKNILEYLYFELILAAIKELDYVDFITSFTGEQSSAFTQNLGLFLNDYAFEQVLMSLNEKARDYWFYLLKTIPINELLHTNLFRTLYIIDWKQLGKYASIYTPEGFYKLKEALRNREVTINYHICDIADIAEEFKGNTYDLVMFDNILQYYKQIKSMDTPYYVNQFVSKKVMPLVNPGGNIQVAYGFQVAKYAAIAIQKGHHNLTGAKRLILEEEIKNGIIPNLIKKFKDYECSFIPGVESTAKAPEQNVILTRRKDNI